MEIIAQTKVKVENINANQTGTKEQLPTQITTANIKKIETELKAEKAPEGIRINVPETILFDFDKYNVREQAKPTLAKINLLLRHYKSAHILINGHTDNQGEDTYNLELSKKRSAAIKYYFINVFKVQNTRMQTKGYGKTKPIAPNNNPDGSDNPAGREKNRRVELIIKN
ncbi:OmpA family protein [Phormidium nigroviride]